MVTSDFLASVGVEFDKQYYEVEEVLDQNVLSTGALRSLDRIIVSYRESTRKNNFYVDLPNAVNLSRCDSSWKFYKVDHKTWGLRYRDYIRKLSGGLTIPASLSSRLSEEAQRVRGGVESSGACYDYHIGLDWRPGDFCEERNSCLWSTYDMGRQLASNEGNLCAVRFYDGSPIGRALLWAVDGVLLVFNAYGHYSREDAAGVVAKQFRAFGGHWEASNVNLDAGGLWVNHNYATAVYPDTASVFHDYEIEIDGLRYCDCCDRWVLDDLTYIDGYGSVCEDCLRDRFRLCDHCGEYVRSHNIYNVEGSRYCQDCIRSISSECSLCGRITLNQDSVCNACRVVAANA